MDEISSAYCIVKVDCWLVNAVFIQINFFVISMFRYLGCNSTSQNVFGLDNTCSENNGLISGKKIEEYLNVNSLL